MLKKNYDYPKFKFNDVNSVKDYITEIPEKFAVQ